MSKANTKSNFNVITKADYGYVSRIRFYQPKKGDKILCCSFSAIKGEADSEGKFEFAYFDLTVVGEKAKQLLTALIKKQENQPDLKVTARLRIGDIFIDQYTDREGKPAALIKGRLLAIEKLWVNKEVVYVEEKTLFSINEIREKLQHTKWNDERIEQFISFLQEPVIPNDDQEDDKSSDQHQESEEPEEALAA